MLGSITVPSGLPCLSIGSGLPPDRLPTAPLVHYVPLPFYACYFCHLLATTFNLPLPATYSCQHLPLRDARCYTTPHYLPRLVRPGATPPPPCPAPRAPTAHSCVAAPGMHAPAPAHHATTRAHPAHHAAACRTTHHPKPYTAYTAYPPQYSCAALRAHALRTDARPHGATRHTDIRTLDLPTVLCRTFAPLRAQHTGRAHAALPPAAGNTSPATTDATGCYGGKHALRLPAHTAPTPLRTYDPTFRINMDVATNRRTTPRRHGAYSSASAHALPPIPLHALPAPVYATPPPYRYTPYHHYLPRDITRTHLPHVW